MTAHIVYAVPNWGHKPQRVLRRGKQLLQRVGVPVSAIGDRDIVHTENWPRKSPYENTRNLFDAFSRAMPSKLYDLSEKIHIEFDKSDVFVGHPSFPYSGKPSVTEFALSCSKVRPKFLSIISPLHCNVSVQTGHINKPFLDSVDRIVDNADVLFAIMGEYWWDIWESSPYARWKKKMIRLDMGIDLAFFPRVKTHFNKPGKRGYLYIGRSDPMKGVGYLSELLRRVGEFPKAWIGYGPDIPGVRRYSADASLTPEFMRHVAEEFDFFITTGVADPNPTTILEAMAWGFPVICTPQSGYYKKEYLNNVFLDDIGGGVEVLRRLQYQRESELMEMADRARAVVQEQYSWDRFTDGILASVRSHVAAGGDK